MNQEDSAAKLSCPVKLRQRTYLDAKVDKAKVDRTKVVRAFRGGGGSA